MICRGQLRNVERFQTHVLIYCSAHEICVATSSVAPPSWAKFPPPPSPGESVNPQDSAVNDQTHFCLETVRDPQRVLLLINISTIPVQRSTNWANKPTGSWSMCWVQINHQVMNDDFRDMKFIYLHGGKEMTLVQIPYGPEFFSGPTFNYSFQWCS